MTDTSPYPRKTVDTVVAVLAGTVGGAVIAWALIAAVLNGRTVTTSSVNASSTIISPYLHASTTEAEIGAITTLNTTTTNATTGNIGAVNATTSNATTANLGTINASTTNAATSLVVGSGTSLTKHLKATASVDVDNLTAGSVTSSIVTLIGAVAAGSVYITPVGSFGYPTSSVNVIGVPGTDIVNLYFQTATSGAVNLNPASWNVDYWAH